MPTYALYLHKFRLLVIAILICVGLMTSPIKGPAIAGTGQASGWGDFE
tara:strand:- start:1160 stop:1303 length:144 start_codon:yes stop_codon:yes gene_type:complete